MCDDGDSFCIQHWLKWVNGNESWHDAKAKTGLFVMEDGCDEMEERMKLNAYSIVSIVLPPNCEWSRHGDRTGKSDAGNSAVTCEGGVVPGVMVQLWWTEHWVLQFVFRGYSLVLVRKAHSHTFFEIWQEPATRRTPGASTSDGQWLLLLHYRHVSWKSAEKLNMHSA